MRWMKRAVIRTLAIAAVAVAVPVGLAGPAYAHPEINRLLCESGHGRFSCFVTFHGQHNPVTIRWYINGVRIPDADNQNHTPWWPCAIGKRYGVKVTVSDVHGSDTANGGGLCLREPQ